MRKINMNIHLNCGEGNSFKNNKKQPMTAFFNVDHHLKYYVPFYSPLVYFVSF